MCHVGWVERLRETLGVRGIGNVYFESKIIGHGLETCFLINGANKTSFL
jgi:hypothetical protein